MLIGSRAAAKKGDEEGQGDLTLQPFASTKVIATRLRMVATVCLRIPTEGFEDLNGIKDVVGLEHQDDDRVTPPKRFSSLPTLERHSVDYDDDDDKFRLAVQEQPQLCASPAELELPELDCLALDWSLSSGAIGSEPEHHSRHHSLETGIPSVLESVPLASAKVAATKRSSKRKSLGSLIELLTLSHQQQEQQKEHSDPLLEPPSSPSPKGSRKKSSWNFQAVTGA